jgi:Zn-dependent protease
LSPSLPGLRFSLFGFPITIGVDFLLITVLIGLGSRPGAYLVEWVVVVAVSILIHELGHAFALRNYSINPEIRLWGMGGLTMSGFQLSPRKSILVSLAGPAVGIPVAIMVMVIRPWLPDVEPLRTILGDLIFINLLWGLVNVLPLAGLDGGSVVTNLFIVTMGERGRTPGLVLVGIASIAIAVVAAVIGFIYLTVVILFFALFNPDPYLVLWRVVSGKPRGYSGGRAPSMAPTQRSGQSAQKLFKADRGGTNRGTNRGNKDGKRGKQGPAVATTADSRHIFGEAYAEVIGGASNSDLDTEDLENRPAPLLPDVIGMVARRDDSAVATRLADETDPLAVLGIVARVVEAKCVPQVRDALARDEARRTGGLLRLQVALHSLGRFEDSIATSDVLGHAGGPAAAVLEARSAARLGDKKRTAAALERALDAGVERLSEAALGDVARLGPDARVGQALARIRSAAPQA